MGWNWVNLYRWQPLWSQMPGIKKKIEPLPMTINCRNITLWYSMGLKRSKVVSHLCIASSTLGPVVRLWTTSSSCMMMSAPMLFWISMDLSGVRSISSPLKGDWNCTPSSVIFASFSRDTIWKPPLSWNTRKLYCPLYNKNTSYSLQGTSSNLWGNFQIFGWQMNETLLTYWVSNLTVGIAEVWLMVYYEEVCCIIFLGMIETITAVFERVH